MMDLLSQKVRFAGLARTSGVMNCFESVIYGKNIGPLVYVAKDCQVADDASIAKSILL